MDIRPEILAAFPNGKVSFLDRNGAQQLTERLGSRAVIFAFRSTTTVDMLAASEGAIFLYNDKRTAVKAWDFEDLRSVTCRKAALNQYAFAFENGRNGQTGLFTTSDSGDVARLATLLQEKLGERLHDERETAQESTSVAPSETSTRTFEIHSLGPSGSGKTVFMASMYQRLRLRRPELAFNLKSDYDSSLYLNTIYNQVANPTEEWPEASRGIHEWTFRACVQTPSGDYEPIEFRYLDYPGGVLTNPRGREAASIQSLVNRLRSANALLILLDGMAVRALLRGEQPGRRYLDFELTSSLEIAQQSRCPVHFAVTKWDLLAGDYTLEDVRNALMADENIRDLVSAKAQDSSATIRLFPISAVGFGFAAPTANGGMRKSGTIVRPYNVELPLLGVLPDFFQFAYEELREGGVTKASLAERMRRGIVSEGTQDRVTPAFRKFARSAGERLRQVIVTRFPRLEAVLSETVLEDVLDFGDRLLAAQAARHREGDARFKEQLLAQRQSIASEEKALELVETQCIEMMAAFEEREPASVLAGGIVDFTITYGQESESEPATTTEENL